MTLPDSAPYDPSTLSVPLSGVQRATMEAWITKEELQKHISISPRPSPTLPDDQLIGLYQAVVAIAGVTWQGPSSPGTAIGPGATISNPIKSVTDFLNLLTHKSLWIRVGEFVVGGIFLAVAVKGITGIDVPTPKKVVKR